MSVYPYDPIYDQMTLINVDLMPAFSLVSSNTQSYGALTVTARTPGSVSTAQWASLLSNMLAYRMASELVVDNTVCASYTMTHRNFTLQGTDSYGRRSNAVQRSMVIKTSVLVFSERTEALTVTDAVSDKTFYTVNALGVAIGDANEFNVSATAVQGSTSGSGGAVSSVQAGIAQITTNDDPSPA